MPFYVKLSHSLTRDKASEALHSYGTTGVQEELLAGPPPEKEAQEGNQVTRSRSPGATGQEISCWSWPIRSLPHWCWNPHQHRM